MTLPATPPQPLGDLLVARAGVDADLIQKALALQQRTPDDRLGGILIRLGAISEQTLLETLSWQLGFAVIREPELSTFVASCGPAHHHLQITAAMAQHLSLLVGQIDGAWCIASTDPLNAELLSFVHARLGKPFDRRLIANRDLERSLANLNRVDDGHDIHEDLRRLAEDAPVIELVNAMLARGTDMRASDIHLEPEEIGFVVRYRIDGVLQASEHYPRERFDAAVSRIKLIAGLDIAERRLPQDGRFSSRMAGVNTDVRVSVIPGVHGESIVMRLLPNMQGKRFDLEKLGLEDDHLALYRQWITSPDGIILVTGPTGSGKSTTLYATLGACDSDKERILTVEDPVEYQVPGVTQFQVQADIGFGFPAALRAILRHDPDTIMIGEIRDSETARIAVQASLTGHRVFSTLHTNDSASAFIRLADMGVEMFLVGATVRGVIAQRLLRRLCPQCREPVGHDWLTPELASDLAHLGRDPAAATFYRAVGCSECHHTGYRGRIAVYEFLTATRKLRQTLSRAQVTPIELLANAEPGFRNLRQDGLIKAWRGVTSLEEVLSVTGLASESVEAR